MATNFFEQQSQARRSTTWLITMFCLSALAIVATVTLVTAIAVSQQQVSDSLPSSDFRWEIPLIAGAVTLVLIILGTLYKVVELRAGGGTGVAERLNGTRIYPDTNDPVARRLLNVVEEMAIASGTPVPPVFLMNDENGINAFAAGYSPSDAVLGVTRGCAEKLSRDELQGVIAHEFSHILNGDMRMSIRLIGILHGILLLGLIGRLMFRFAAYSGHGRSRNSNSGNAGLVLLLVGLSLVILGFVGTLLGNLIKAAVSRQREYLADASAVQFTRNPSGIANALKKIGGAVSGSKVAAPSAAEASHMFFAKGVWEGFSGLWATHPPLSKRIRAIEPSWDGRFIGSDASVAGVSSTQAAGFAGEAEPVVAVAAAEVPVTVVDHAIEQVGEPTEAHREYASKLLASIPETIKNAAREVYGARAVTFCLLLDRAPEIHRKQFQLLEKIAEKDLVQLTAKMAPEVDKLDVRTRLPLVDLALPALRSMSPSQYQRFSSCFVQLVRADNRLELFEWVLSQVLMWHLRPQFEKVRSPRISYYGLQKLAKPCSTILSAVSYAGNSDDQASDAFQNAAGHFPEVPVRLLSREEAGLFQLREALNIITRVAAKHRGRLVDACAAAICADGHVAVQEAELLRGISDLLDCPMPPLLAGQEVERPNAVHSVSG